MGGDGRIPWTPWSMHSTPSEHMDESTHDLESNLGAILIRMTYIGNTNDDRIECAEGLEIGVVDGV